ncbi:MAG: aldehyde dehydrogenase family protein [Chloroflexota bacterium]
MARRPTSSSRTRTRPRAIAGSLFTAFYNTGRICTSGSRLLVQRSNADALVERFVERAWAIKVGDPGDAGVQLGPLVSAEQEARVTGYIQEGLRAARKGCAGRRPSERARGGRLLRGARRSSWMSRRTCASPGRTGPVLSVLTFEDEEEAIRIANDVMCRAWRRRFHDRPATRLPGRRGIDAGIIWTNCPHYLPVNVPYEGYKLSGLGEVTRGSRR